MIRISSSHRALDGHRTTLKAYFREHPTATVKEAAAKIEELTGVVGASVSRNTPYRINRRPIQPARMLHTAALMVAPI